MIGFLWRVIVGRFTPRPPVPRCEHKWAREAAGDLKVDGRIKGFFYILRCEKCGDMKQHRFMADG